MWLYHKLACLLKVGMLIDFINNCTDVSKQTTDAESLVMPECDFKPQPYKVSETSCLLYLLASLQSLLLEQKCLL